MLLNIARRLELGEHEAEVTHGVVGVGDAALEVGLARRSALVLIHPFVHSLLHRRDLYRPPIQRPPNHELRWPLTRGPRTHLSIRSFIHSFLPSFIHSLIHSCLSYFIHGYITSFLHSFTHAFLHAFIGSFIHSFIH
jgi:hypothetical protein